MLGLQKIYRKYGIDCLALVFAGLGEWWLLSFASCTGYHYQPNRYAAYENQTIFNVCTTGGPVWLAGRLVHYIVSHPDVFLGFMTALATGAIAWFTYSLRNSTNEQGRLTQQSIDLARQEYVSTHRPKLRVRHIRPRLRHGEPISVHCTVVNIGETSARLDRYEVTVATFPINGPKLQESIILKGHDLVGGQSEVFFTERGTSFTYDESWNLDQPHGGPMFIRGILEYLDDNNVIRRTGFSRKYNPTTNSFSFVDDPEFEYED
jgi:hypothetical protein